MRPRNRRATPGCPRRFPPAGSASWISVGPESPLSYGRSDSAATSRWIDLPIFDEQGEPLHRRGITAIPGLSFVGLQRLYKRKSSFFYGLEEDATHLAEHIAART